MIKKILLIIILSFLVISTNTYICIADLQPTTDNIVHSSNSADSYYQTNSEMYNQFIHNSNSSSFSIKTYSELNIQKIHSSNLSNYKIFANSKKSDILVHTTNSSWNKIKVLDVDLVVENITFNKTNPIEGEPIKITAEIKNIGSDNINSNFSIFFFEKSYYDYYEFDENGSLGYIENVKVNGLKAGESKNITIVWEAGQIINIYNEEIIVYADLFREINEINEENNSLRESIFVNSLNNFKIDIDAYHFKNYNNTDDDKTQLQGFLKALFNMLDIPIEFYPIYLLMMFAVNKKSEESGHCYGISATSILYYLDLINKPVQDTTFDMLKNAEGVKTNINAYQLKQVPSIINSIILDNQNTSLNIQNEYNEIKDLIENDIPVMLSITAYKDSVTLGGHSVVAIDFFDVSDDLKNIVIYDNNFPGMTKTIQFNFTSNKINYFYYDYQNKKDIYFKYNSYSVAIAYESDLIEKSLMYVWAYINLKLNDLFKSNKKILSFECPINVTIEDENGQIINETLNEIPGSEIFIFNESKTFFLPDDLSYNITIDSYDNGNFNFSQISSISNESSYSKGVTNITVTNQTIGYIDLPEENSTFILEMDYDNDGIIDEEIPPDIEGLIETYTKPILFDHYPANNSENCSRPVDKLSISIVDYDNDTFNVYFKWKNMDNDWILIENFSAVTNGTFQHFPNGNNWIWGNTLYIWSVNVTDGNNWVNNSYYYKTTGSRYDVNNNDIVNFQDAGLCWIHRDTVMLYDGLYDVNQNGVVNFQDSGLCWVNRD